MRTCVFVGPSSGDISLPESWDRYGPAALGAIWRAVEQGFDRIVLVDGVFGMVPAVWHKEILYALASGRQVYGASSMGALRAAETSRYGMVGFGVIFRLYRAQVLTDDDEVCLVHGPRDYGFKPLSLPMVSIRRALSRMARSGELERTAARRVCAAVKARHFSERTLETVGSEIEASGALRCAPAKRTGSDAVKAFERRYEDLKVRDYRALVEALRAVKSAPTPRAPDLPAWTQLETSKWRSQFAQERDTIPELQPW